MRRLILGALALLCVSGVARAQTAVSHAPHQDYSDYHPGIAPIVIVNCETADELVKAARSGKHGVCAKSAFAQRELMRAAHPGRMMAAVDQTALIQGLLNDCYRTGAPGLCDIDLHGATYQVSGTVYVIPGVAGLRNGVINCGGPNGTACIYVTNDPQTGLATNVAPNLHNVFKNLQINGRGQQTAATNYTYATAPSGIPADGQTGIYYNTFNKNNTDAATATAMDTDNVSIRGFDYAINYGNNTYCVQWVDTYVYDNTYGLWVGPNLANAGEKNVIRGGNWYQNTWVVFEAFDAEMSIQGASFDFNQDDSHGNPVGGLFYMEDKFDCTGCHVEYRFESNRAASAAIVQMQAYPNTSASTLYFSPGSSWTVDSSPGCSGYPAGFSTISTVLSNNNIWIPSSFHGFCGGPNLDSGGTAHGEVPPVGGPAWGTATTSTTNGVTTTTYPANGASVWTPWGAITLPLSYAG